MLGNGKLLGNLELATAVGSSTSLDAEDTVSAQVD